MSYHKCYNRVRMISSDRFKTRRNGRKKENELTKPSLRKFI